MRRATWVLVVSSLVGCGGGREVGRVQERTRGGGARWAPETMSWVVPAGLDAQSTSNAVHVCNDSSYALLATPLNGKGKHIVICRAGTCTKPLAIPGIMGFPKLGLASDHVVIAVSRYGHLVWWKTMNNGASMSQPHIARLPSGAGLAGLVTWDKAVHVVLRSPKGVRIAPLLK